MNVDNKPIKNLILDMDGVLWHGDTPVPGLQTFFETLDRKRIRYVLATNNATKTASQYVQKLAGFGVSVAAECILTSAEATALYLRKNFPKGGIVYPIGEDGLTAALKAQGFEVIEDKSFVGADARADFVVVGMTRYVCYEHFASGAYLIDKGAKFIGTNPDVTFPTEIGPLPGAGSLLAFLETATGTRPLIIGKPNVGIFKEATRRLNAADEETVMVGDRLNTDIVGAKNAGLRAILLLSGITHLEDLKHSEVQPDWIFQDLRELNEFLIRGNN